MSEPQLTDETILDIVAELIVYGVQRETIKRISDIGAELVSIYRDRAELQQFGTPPIGVTLDTYHGTVWPVFRFRDMADPSNDKTNATMAHLMTRLLGGEVDLDTED